MVLPTPHIPPNMGGPEAQSGTLRGELEIGSKFGPPQPLLGPPGGIGRNRPLNSL